MPIPTILTQSYNYDLPQSKIAQRPLSIRDESKLLIYENGACRTDTYKNLARLLPQDSLLVFNNSKVIPARLIYIKETSGVIELFCLEPKEGTPYQALQQQGQSNWICMIGGLKKWNTQNILQWKSDIDTQIILSARFIQSYDKGFEIEFSWNDKTQTFADKLTQLGQMPIPPYLLRKAELNDSIRYQTLYASVEGSVAAPTAGLHFTEHIIHDLTDHNITQAFTTLHVGAGTFKPVTSEFAHEHQMHAEWIEADLNLIQQLSKFGQISCVGTTSLRTVESLFWYALYCFENRRLQKQEFVLPQFIPYEKQTTQPKKLLFEYLLELMAANQINKIIFKTELMILPGYIMKVASHLITNFHQPHSTLLMLVDAFTKGKWLEIYNYALQHDYRFLSYGDGSLLTYK